MCARREHTPDSLPRDAATTGWQHLQISAIIFAACVHDWGNKRWHFCSTAQSATLRRSSMLQLCENCAQQYACAVKSSCGTNQTKEKRRKKNGGDLERSTSLDCSRLEHSWAGCWFLLAWRDDHKSWMISNLRLAGGWLLISSCIKYIPLFLPLTFPPLRRSFTGYTRAVHQNAQGNIIHANATE